MSTALPAPGDRVLYRLTKHDARLINSWRDNFELSQAAAGHRHPHRTGGSRDGGSPGSSGHQAHIGAPVAKGDVLPADVSRVPRPESGRLNLRVLTDGNDVYRVTGVPQGSGPGMWAVRP